MCLVRLEYVITFEFSVLNLIRRTSWFSLVEPPIFHAQGTPKAFFECIYMPQKRYIVVQQSKNMENLFFRTKLVKM